MAEKFPVIIELNEADIFTIDLQTRIKTKKRARLETDRIALNEKIEGIFP